MKLRAKIMLFFGMNKFLYIFPLIAAFFLCSCSSDSSTSTVKSSVAKLSAFSFAKNDSMPGLAAAVFTIDERLDTGLVWNKDSILYGTSLDTVVPKFTFAATPSSAILKTPDTTLALTGYDTLSFSKQPIYITIRSQDGTNTKVYEIRPSVHQVDPDLYTWTLLTDGVYPVDESEQRVVELDDEFVMIRTNGFELYAYSSVDGETWTDLGMVSGLPGSARVRQIISNGDTLFYGEDNMIFQSVDAVNWDVTYVSYEVQTMIMYWNDHIWVLVDNDGQELAYWNGTELTLTGLKPMSDFPISDFAAVQFSSSSERARAMIIGGFAENGRSLNSRWNFEYSRHIKENGGYRIEEYSIDRPTFTTLTGVSVIWYNDQLLMFGGVDADMKYFGRDILISNDEGLNWTQADSVKNQLPEVYQARQKQTAIVRDNYIYLFGGQDNITTFSDVYRGKLNSIDW